MAERGPSAPALAYNSMSRLLGDEFSLEPPPKSGALLEVVAVDGIATQWAMSAEWAQSLMEPLQLDSTVVRVIPSRY